VGKLAASEPIKYGKGECFPREIKKGKDAPKGRLIHVKKRHFQKKAAAVHEGRLAEEGSSLISEE